MRLGVDVGRVRIGVARSDRHGMLAMPVATVARDEHSMRALSDYALEFEATEVVVGLPLSLSGSDTASTADARDFAERVAVAMPMVEVRLVDERLSTVSAQQALRSSGRNSRNSRAVVDQVAAVIILQHALDAERSGGVPPGTTVGPRTQGT